MYWGIAEGASGVSVGYVFVRVFVSVFVSVFAWVRLGLTLEGCAALDRFLTLTV